MQELQIMNVQMHIITEDNVDQLLSMSFSNNINKLMKNDGDAAVVVKEINQNIEKRLKEVSRAPLNIPEPVVEIETPPAAPALSPIMVPPIMIPKAAPQPESGSSTPYNPNTPTPSSTPYNPNTPDNLGPPTASESVPLAPGTSESVPLAPASSSTTVPLAPATSSTTVPLAPESSSTTVLLAPASSSTDSSILEVRPPPPPPAEASEEKKSEEGTKKIIL
jgi:hypothetical protein